jgi:ubiquitin C-terminal hydrolase
MNSAIQCLSHCRELRRYFLDFMLFRDDLNCENRDGSPNAEVTIMFIRFLHSMWNRAEVGQYRWEKNIYSPAPLQRALGKINDMFKGTMQNDTNEFLGCLLHTLHQDLNRVKEKPKVTIPQPLKLMEMSNEELQSVFSEAHLKENQSIIQDLMFGQTRSVVKCYACQCES